MPKMEDTNESKVLAAYEQELQPLLLDSEVDTVALKIVLEEILNLI